MMIFVLNLIFFCSLILILHSYILYPLSIWLFSLFVKKNYTIDNLYKPKVSVIISAFNEEKVIENTIRKLIDSDYPKEMFEIIVGSDNSEDGTNSILDNLSIEFPNLKVIKFTERRGKARVLNDLYKMASSNVFIFCDANTLYKPDAIGKMVSFYKNPEVGGVSGKLKLLDFEESKLSGTQETKYWDFETWLKEKEGKLGILIGANGGIYSLRKELFFEVPTTHPVSDDFYLTLKVLEAKKDFLYINDAIGEELTAPTIKAEFNRKVRTTSNNIYTIKAIKNLLKPTFGLRAYGLWSHKIIRWLSPILLAVLFLTNLLLFNESIFYKIFLLAQLTFYLSGFCGLLFKKFDFFLQPLLMIYYFIITNVAMFLGLIKFIMRKQTNLWRSTPR